MKLQDLVSNDWFEGVMDGIREEFEWNEEGKEKLQSILNLDLSDLDENILVFINQFENIVDEYQEAYFHLLKLDIVQSHPLQNQA